MSSPRTIDIHVGALPDLGAPADISVARGAIGYRVLDSCSIAHHNHMSRDELLDLVIVASRLLDAWAND